MYETYDDILTVDDIAEALKIGSTQAYKIIQSGQIYAFKEGKSWRIPKKGLIEYINYKSKLNLK